MGRVLGLYLMLALFGASTFAAGLYLGHTWPEEPLEAVEEVRPSDSGSLTAQEEFYSELIESSSGESERRPDPSSPLDPTG